MPNDHQKCLHNDYHGQQRRTKGNYLARCMGSPVPYNLTRMLFRPCCIGGIGIDVLIDPPPTESDNRLSQFTTCKHHKGLGSKVKTPPLNWFRGLKRTPQRWRYAVPRSSCEQLPCTVRVPNREHPNCQFSANQVEWITTTNCAS